MSDLADCMKNAKDPSVQKMCIETFSAERGKHPEGKQDAAPVRTTQTREQAVAAREACSNAQFSLEDYKTRHAGVNGVGEFFGNVGNRMKETGQAAVDGMSGVRPKRFQPMNRESFTDEERAEIHKLELARDAACAEVQTERRGRRR